MCTEMACHADLGGDGGSDLAADMSPDADSGTPVVECSKSPITFPTFDKACTDSKQCGFGWHQTDCCGSQLGVGWNVAEKTRFDAAEKTCRMQFPICGCPAGPQKTEDGQVYDGTKPVVSVCTAKGCMTTLL